MVQFDWSIQLYKVKKLSWCERFQIISKFDQDKVHPILQALKKVSNLFQMNIIIFCFDNNWQLTSKMCIIFMITSIKALHILGIFLIKFSLNDHIEYLHFYKSLLKQHVKQAFPSFVRHIQITRIFTCATNAHQNLASIQKVIQYGKLISFSLILIHNQLQLFKTKITLIQYNGKQNIKCSRTMPTMLWFSSKTPF